MVLASPLFRRRLMIWAAALGISLVAMIPVQAAGSGIDAQRVIDVLIDADIDLLDWTILDDETDPNHLLGRPGQYVSKAIFWDSRIGDPERGPEAGTVEVFRTEKDLLSRKRYIETIGQNLPMLVQYQFQHGLVLLRLNKRFSIAEARQYERALRLVK